MGLNKKLILNIMVFVFTILLIQIVSAGECCTIDIHGNVCRNYTSSMAGNCSVTNILPTDCEDIDACKTGCCYVEDQGLCKSNSRKLKCEIDQGEWHQESCATLDKCDMGCCILDNSDARFVTQRSCELLCLCF